MLDLVTSTIENSTSELSEEGYYCHANSSSSLSPPLYLNPLSTPTHPNLCYELFRPRNKTLPWKNIDMSSTSTTQEPLANISPPNPANPLTARDESYMATPRNVEVSFQDSSLALDVESTIDIPVTIVTPSQLRYLL